MRDGGVGCRGRWSSRVSKELWQTEEGAVFESSIMIPLRGQGNFGPRGTRTCRVTIIDGNIMTRLSDDLTDEGSCVKGILLLRLHFVLWCISDYQTTTFPFSKPVIPQLPPRTSPSISLPLPPPRTPTPIRRKTLMPTRISPLPHHHTPTRALRL